jgi:hypothetical protein
MITAKTFCDLVQSNRYDTLKDAYSSGELNGVKWSWVTRINPSISLEEEYLKITGNSRPACKTCGVNQVSSFLSFAAGYNLYCSKSCAKRDPLVQQKKVEALSARPNWKQEALEKAKATNELKYGAPSPLKNQEVLRRRRETNLSRYGSTEVLSAESAIRSKITSEVAANKVFSRVENFSHVAPLFSRSDFKTADDAYAWRCLGCGSTFSSALSDGGIPKCTRCNPKTSSSGENELRKFMEGLLPNEEVVQRYKLNKKTEIDVYIPSRNLGIEFNGVYWHSELAGKSKNYHLNKKAECSESGINLMQFWDSQWDHKKDIVKSIISGALGFNSRVYARKCAIKRVGEKESSQFLEKNHLSGNARGSFLRLALFLDDKLVSLATFSKPRYSREKDSVELLRFCTALNTTCVGAASRLIKEAIKLCDAKKIISFCDEMCFTGSVYQSLNFVKISPGKPSAWYFSGDGILRHRTAFQKKKLLELLKLSESNLTEWDLAQQLKLNRVWDCGSSKWELDAGSVR